MTLRHAILGIIAQKPSTGFELLREFDAGHSVIWPAPQNEVYRVLRQLKDEGLAEIVAEGARGSRTYAATDAGRAELGAWLAAPSDYTLRYEPVLKACFLDQTDPQSRIARARQDLAFFQEQLRVIERTARQKAGQPGPVREDARAMAVALYTALSGWARAIVEEGGSEP
ncbi:PadR family transcriptional regulator [Alkalicaulis satelles]|nr:PadR family transcriptional regulator [Alkalicaulis satelles]